MFARSTHCRGVFPYYIDRLNLFSARGSHLLHVFKIAEWARKRARNRIANVKKSDADSPRMYSAINQTFHERLLDACKRVPDDPKGLPDIAFLACPERLLGKLSYLCLDKQKRSWETIRSERPEEVHDEMVHCLIEYENEEPYSAFSNLRTAEQFRFVKSILLGHGLSPIGDSILILADIGRAYRAAFAMGLDIQVMLADISWMSSNRSIRQFETLKDSDIDTGLRVCLDRRTRLYDAMEIAHDIHEILPYEKAKKISGKKLKQISSRYVELAKTIWGESTTSRLEREQIKRIAEPIYRTASTPSEDFPSYLITLGQFAGVLSSIEEALKPHLEILRVIAKQFSSFDEEVFTYFFAQYYAQDAYRGSVLKIAPVSERNFDEPFDKLDKYFRAWGEGHSVGELAASGYTPPTTPPLSAVYLPQYMLGNMSVLPYAPLSLDALKQEAKDHELVRKKLMMLDSDVNLYGQHVLNIALLKQTPLAKRNRLIADLASFLLLCTRRGYEKELADGCEKMGVGTFEDLLAAFSKNLVNIFVREKQASSAGEIEELWMTWFKNTDREADPDYIPLHLYFLFMDASDWTEDTYSAAASICLLAHMTYLVFT